jgi:Thioredoxin reductase
MNYDVVIIGGGCAGMSAAVYAASRNQKVLLLEKEPLMGGTINHISTITHFLGAEMRESGRELAARMAMQLEYDNITVMNQEEAVGIDCEHDTRLVVTTKHQYRAGRVIIAAGTTQREAGFVNDNPGAKKYTSHCAITDGAACSGRTVLVVGGSDGAAKEALYLSKIADKVVLVAVEETLSAIPEFSQMITRTPNIQVYTGSSITGVTGGADLEAVEITSPASAQKVVIPAPEGRIFVYAGSTPNTSWCSGIQAADGYLDTDKNMQTNISGIYAVGDIRVKPYRQISTAIADGTVAAIHACTSMLRR